MLIRRRDGWSTAAQVVLLIISAFMVIGALGEALSGATADVPRVVQMFSGLWGTIAGALLAVLCARSILANHRVHEST